MFLWIWIRKNLKRSNGIRNPHATAAAGVLRTMNNDDKFPVLVIQLLEDLCYLCHFSPEYLSSASGTSLPGKNNRRIRLILIKKIENNIEKYFNK